MSFAQIYFEKNQMTSRVKKNNLVWAVAVRPRKTMEKLFTVHIQRE
jgi:hypothetical protein